MTINDNLYLMVSSPVVFSFLEFDYIYVKLTSSLFSVESMTQSSIHHYYYYCDSTFDFISAFDIKPINERTFKARPSQAHAQLK